MRLLRPYFYLLLILITTISACQTTPKTGQTEPDDGTITVPGATGTELTSTEEDIIRAFELETDKSWLEAAQLYQSLAENGIQPDRSSFYIRAALMFYYDERYRYI
ncbi:MAG: hypothetical protein GY771_02015, partial [bacterium]|nr:hypothetical protein [bacterium]